MFGKSIFDLCSPFLNLPFFYFNFFFHGIRSWTGSIPANIAMTTTNSNIHPLIRRGNRAGIIRSQGCFLNMAEEQVILHLWSHLHHRCCLRWDITVTAARSVHLQRHHNLMISSSLRSIVLHCIHLLLLFKDAQWLLTSCRVSQLSQAQLEITLLVDLCEAWRHRSETTMVRLHWANTKQMLHPRPMRHQNKVPHL